MIDWIKQHTLIVIFCVVGIVGGAFCLDHFLGKHPERLSSDYQSLQALLSCCQRGEIPSMEILEGCEKLMSSHPELHTRYDGLLSLCFFQQEQTTKGLAYSRLALEKAKKQGKTPYTEYAEITCLIVDKDFTTALAQSQQLENTLKDQQQWQLLRAFNLLRLAFLAEELQLNDERLKAWQTVQTLPTYNEVASLFEQESFTLKDYFARAALSKIG